MSCKIKHGGLPVKIEPLKHKVNKIKINNPALDRAKEILDILKQQQNQ